MARQIGAAHAAFGMALAALALAAVAIAWRRGGMGGRAASVIGALAVVGAGFNGASFVNYGHDVSSLIMAVLFGRNGAGLVVSVACSTAIVYLIRRSRGGSITDPGLGRRNRRF